MTRSISFATAHWTRGIISTCRHRGFSADGSNTAIRNFAGTSLAERSEGRFGKDKTFFFATYEGLRATLYTTNTTTTMGTEA